MHKINKLYTRECNLVKYLNATADEYCSAYMHSAGALDISPTDAYNASNSVRYAATMNLDSFIVYLLRSSHAHVVDLIWLVKCVGLLQ